MTPERWRRVDELFDAALRIDPAGRESWLRGACGDDDLRAEVGRLLVQDARAARDGFLTPPELADRPVDRTGSWPPREGRRPPGGPDPIDRVEAGSGDGDDGGFTPRAAIAKGVGPPPISEPRSVVRARLRELPVIYILILAMAN